MRRSRTGWDWEGLGDDGLWDRRQGRDGMGRCYAGMGQDRDVTRWV